MKKFLSLALALVMTLSLVTISAGATEYKDFTDRDEIQYEEAVAVLNRLGIITGYSEGDFRPEGELTRGAAAKIIVSLLIGPEAAEALPTTGNPYPDVPAGNVFAGVISFCKTEGIISGYGDGTFRPTGTLTGFAFAKMLLGALGFDNKIEGFEGAGWTMNVANLGQKAGLFDRISFKGGDTVNRETACQLALNTLKATMVEYGGNGVTQITVNGVPVEIGNGQKWSYVTSNQDFARNIGRNQRDYNQADWYTVEFGEEHFVDLRLEHDKKDPTEDEFGRPSVEWSYKRVTIGTFPLEADYSYNTQVAHDVPETSDASKVRALNLGSYVVSKTVGGTTRNTTLWLNGVEYTNSLAKVADIADYTDNGAEVYVYISYEDGFADLISDVVVIQSQLMQIKRVGSDAVSLEVYDNSHPDKNHEFAADGISGYNQDAIDVDVADVEVNDDYFTTLSGMKAGDLVVVKPYSEDGIGKYDVGELYIPETVTGALTNVTNHGTSSQNRKAIAVTVGGTKYNIAQWNKKLAAIDGDTLKITRGDVTLTLDEFGNAMLGKNIGETSDWMVVGNFRQSLVDGRLVTIVNGWDISGDPVELNIGPSDNGNERNGARPGDLVYYTSDTSNSVTDWNISLNPADGVYDVYTGKDLDNTSDYSIKTSNSRVAMYGYDRDATVRDVPAGDAHIGAVNDWTTKTYKTYGVGTMDSSVKFIFVNFNDAGEVSSIDVRTGARNVTNQELVNANGGRWAQACVKTDKGVNTVKAVVIKQESSEGDASTLGYISKYIGQATLTSSISSTQNDAANTMTSVQYDNRVVYTYTATLRNASGLEGESVTIYSYDKLDAGDFFYYTKREVEGYDNFYDIRKPANIVGRATSVVHAELWGIYNADKGLIQVGNYTWPNGTAMYPAIATYQRDDTLGTGDDSNLLNLTRAVWTDLTGNRIDSMSDLKDYLADEETTSGTPKYNHYLNLRMVLNDNPESDGFRDVYMIVIFDERAPSAGKDVDPKIYKYFIATPGGTDPDGNTTPPTYTDVKYNFTATDADGVMTDITIDGKAATLEELNGQLADGSTIKFKVPEGYTVTGATLGEDGFYTATVGKDATSISVTKKGEEPPVEGNGVTVKLSSDTLGTVAVKDAQRYANKATANMTLTAPDWVYIDTTYANADIDGTISYDIYVNDKRIDSATTAVKAATDGKSMEASTAFTVDTDDAPGVDFSSEDTKVEFVITAVKWTNAKVLYKLETADGVDMVKGGSSNNEEFLPVDTANQTIKLRPSNTRYSGTGTYEVTGTTAAENPTGSITDLTSDTSITSLTAKGGEPVVVIVKGLTDAQAGTTKITGLVKGTEYLIGDTATMKVETINNTLLASAAMINISALTGSGTDDDAGTWAGFQTTDETKLRVSIASGGANAAEIGKYTVIIDAKYVGSDTSIDQYPQTLDVTVGGSADTTRSILMEKDVEVTVTITESRNAHVDTTKLDVTENGQVTIYFDADVVDFTSNVFTDSSNIENATAGATGTKSASFTVKNPEPGDTITFKTGAVKTAGGTVMTDDVTLTYGYVASEGKETWTWGSATDRRWTITVPSNVTGWGTATKAFNEAGDSTSPVKVLPGNTVTLYIGSNGKVTRPSGGAQAAATTVGFTLTNGVTVQSIAFKKNTSASWTDITDTLDSNAYILAATDAAAGDILEETGKVRIVLNIPESTTATDFTIPDITFTVGDAG